MRSLKRVGSLTRPSLTSLRTISSHPQTSSSSSCLSSLTSGRGLASPRWLTTTHSNISSATLLSTRSNWLSSGNFTSQRRHASSSSEQKPPLKHDSKTINKQEQPPVKPPPRGFENWVEKEDAAASSQQETPPPTSSSEDGGKELPNHTASEKKKSSSSSEKKGNAKGTKSLVKPLDTC